MGESPKVVWAEFSTLSWAVFVMSVIAWLRQEHTYRDLKTQPIKLFWCEFTHTVQKLDHFIRTNNLCFIAKERYSLQKV